MLEKTKVLIAVLSSAAIIAFSAGAAERQRAVAASARQAHGKPPPIPRAGPLAQPRSRKQVGLPEQLTPATIALGEKLFFDGRLSADGTVACATCHDPARAFTDGRPGSIGIHGRAGQRNAPTILNALYNHAQFWDGRARALEDQATFPIVNPIEMGQPTLQAAVAKIAGISEYRQAFRKAFGRPVNGPDLLRAIARTSRPQRDTKRAFGPKPPRLKPPQP